MDRDKLDLLIFVVPIVCGFAVWVIVGEVVGGGTGLSNGIGLALGIATWYGVFSWMTE